MEFLDFTERLIFLPHDCPQADLHLRELFRIRSSLGVATSCSFLPQGTRLSLVGLLESQSATRQAHLQL